MTCRGYQFALGKYYTLEGWLNLRAECETEWVEETRTGSWRGDADGPEFGEWLAAKAQPHMRDHKRYAEAMTIAERRRAIARAKGTNHDRD